MLKAIDEERNQKAPNRKKVKSLILNLYYLSGYIIECMVKYAIYDLIKYGKEDDVTNLNKAGLTYDTHIRHHRFERYTEHLINNLPNKKIHIPLITSRKGISKETVSICKAWDAEIRYSYELEYKEICHYMEFYNYAREIFKIIKNDITMG